MKTSNLKKGDKVQRIKDGKIGKIEKRLYSDRGVAFTIKFDDSDLGWYVSEDQMKKEYQRFEFTEPLPAISVPDDLLTPPPLSLGKLLDKEPEKKIQYVPIVWDQLKKGDQIYSDNGKTRNQFTIDSIHDCCLKIVNPWKDNSYQNLSRQFVEKNFRLVVKPSDIDEGWEKSQALNDGTLEESIDEMLKDTIEDAKQNRKNLQKIKEVEKLVNKLGYTLKPIAELKDRSDKPTQGRIADSLEKIAEYLKDIADVKCREWNSK